MAISSTSLEVEDWDVFYLYEDEDYPVYWVTYHEMTGAEKEGLDGVMGYLFPNALRMASATNRFNCHSYAWYSQDVPTNMYWIYDPSSYWESGMYSLSTIAVGRKVFYEGSEHSAIVIAYSPTGAYNTTFISKWAQAGIYLHAPTYGPPEFGMNQGRWYYQ